MALAALFCYLRFEKSVRSSCRMAATPYPAYNTSPHPVFVGLLSTAPAGNLFGPEHCRMAATPYPAYNISPHPVFPGLLSAAPAGVERIAGWRHKCLIRPTRQQAIIYTIHFPLRINSPRQYLCDRVSCLVYKTQAA
jgi:hypothetical protein